MVWGKKKVEETLKADTQTMSIGVTEPLKHTDLKFDDSREVRLDEDLPELEDLEEEMEQEVKRGRGRSPMETKGSGVQIVDSKHFGIQDAKKPQEAQVEDKDPLNLEALMGATQVEKELVALQMLRDLLALEMQLKDSVTGLHKEIRGLRLDLRAKR